MTIATCNVHAHTNRPALSRGAYTETPDFFAKFIAEDFERSSKLLRPRISNQSERTIGAAGVSVVVSPSPRILEVGERAGRQVPGLPRRG
jgi:hypothetical protein